MSKHALVLQKAGAFQVLAIIAGVGREATKRFFEFFTVPIPNKNAKFSQTRGRDTAFMTEAVGVPCDRRGQKVLLEDMDSELISKRKGRHDES